MAKLTPEEREILINALVETEAIEEDDRSVYEKLRDDKLIAFSEIALNSETDDDDDDADDDDDDEEVVDNSEDESEDDEESDEDFEDEEEDEDEEAPATNAHVCNKCAGKMKGKKGKKAPAMEEEEMTGNMTTEDWYNNAPPEVVEVVANAMKLTNDEKAKLIDQMTSNMSGAQKVAAVKVYSRNTLEELKVIAPGMIQNAQPKMTMGEIPGMTRRSFAGAGAAGNPTNNSKGKAKSDPLVMPTINWKEVVSEFSN